MPNLREAKYLFLDTETGGIGLDKSLLTASFILTDGNFNTTDQLELYCKPKNGIYSLTAEALTINKIDIIKHDEIALINDKCGTLLYNFLAKNIDSSIRVIPIGKNIYFDLLHIWENLIRRPTWEKYVSYRVFDLTTLCEYGRMTGHIPESVSGGLQSLANFYGLSTEGCHTATGDAVLTKDVLRSMLDHLQGIRAGEENG